MIPLREMDLETKKQLIRIYKRTIGKVKAVSIEPDNRLMLWLYPLANTDFIIEELCIAFFDKENREICLGHIGKLELIVSESSISIQIAADYPLQRYERVKLYRLAYIKNDINCQYGEFNLPQCPS